MDPTMSDVLSAALMKTQPDAAIAQAASASVSTTSLPTERKQIDHQVLRSVAWDDILVLDGVLQSIHGYPIELYKSKDLRTVCSALRVKGVKNAQKVHMVQRLTECKHAKMGISAEVKAPFSISVEAESRKRAREEKEETRYQLDSFKKREEDDARMRTLTQAKMRVDLHHTLIGSYAILQKCILETLNSAESTPAANIFQPDIETLLKLKRSIVKQMLPGEDTDSEEEMIQSTDEPTEKCNSGPSAVEDGV